MSKESSRPTFSGIADSKCKCTPGRLCRWCLPNSTDERESAARFRGKFREPWNDAVKIDRIKNGGEK